jgi:hypothetical protein
MPTLVMALSLATGATAVAKAVETVASAKVESKLTAKLPLVKLPPGFTISLVTDETPGARQMALSPKGTLFVGTQEAGKVYAIAKIAEEIEKKNPRPKVVVVSSGLNRPNGVAIKDGDLYVAEISRILKFPAVEKNLARPPKPTVFRDDYPKDLHHGWKVIAFGPDGWLYVPVGAPCNRCLEDNELYASITRLSPDGKTREIVARGVRNTVGFDWQGGTKDFWFTDNGADNLGDDVPADELNRLSHSQLGKPAPHYGFPYCHAGDFKDPKFGRDKNCGPGGGFEPPVVKLGPHVAALGMKFYTGTQFPERYRGGVFIAEHGSWNRSSKIGYRITFVPFEGGQAKNDEIFAEGWLQGQSEWGRPVDVLMLGDGSLLVSDDSAGAIYRISYQGPQ